MAKPKHNKTIYFLAGIQATPEELADAEQYMPGVVFRLATKVEPGSPVEPFDAVAGTVPEHYAASDGKPAPTLRKWEKRLAVREAVKAEAEPHTEKPARRKKAAVASNLPSIDAPAPASAAWGAAPAVAPPPPAPAARPTWKPNS